MRDYRKKYYEQSSFWTHDYYSDSAEKERMEEIFRNIPPDTRSVLDVGCGNGAFVENLMRTFPDRIERILGLDFSMEALRYMKSEKICGTITHLPFKSESFDLVTCFEVLEHLPHKDFGKGILELQRVSQKYIMITVPNDQHLEQSLVICPECHGWYNPYFHMRSFDKVRLLNLFDVFRLIKIAEIGPLMKFRSYNYLLVIFYRALRKHVPPKTAICPQCGYQQPEKSMNRRKKDKAFSDILLRSLFSLKFLAKLCFPLKKKHRWLLALYEKVGN